MQPILDLDLLHTFITVVQTGELKKAAEIVCRSQGAVSMQIKKLEAQVGNQLMTRSNRGIQLTKSGETLLSYSKQMLQLNNATLKALHKRDLTGQLRFGVPTDYAQNFLQILMPIFKQNFPHVEAIINCQRSRVLREKIALGELDIAIVAAEPNSQDELCLWSERLVWSAPLSTSLENLPLLPVAIYEDDCIIRDYSLEDLKRSKIDYQTVLSSPILDNIASAVDAGFAISLLPESLIAENKSRSVISSKLNSNKMLQMNMISRSGMQESKLQRIYDCMTAAFAKY
jgi:DNA-binding transcriptional LysR family regulator